MPNPDPFGSFDFEQLRKMLQQMGLGDADQLNLEELLAQVARMQQSGQGLMFGMTNADRDPEAAWRTTLTAACLCPAQSTSTAVSMTPMRWHC